MTTIPRQDTPVRLNDNWFHLPAWLPVPGLGVLAVNSFVLKGPEPVLVDTGLAALEAGFLTALKSVIDPADLKYIWLSHLDADHSGNLEAVLRLAPDARVVSNFLGMGKMGLMGLDTARVHLLGPGNVLSAGRHSLAPIRPPYYDAPETIGFFESRDRVLFAADSFGAVLDTPELALDAISDRRLREGMANWAALDAPWLALTDTDAFHDRLTVLDRLDPALTLTGHLPVAHANTGRLTRYAARAAALSARTTDPISPERLIAAGQ